MIVLHMCRWWCFCSNEIPRAGLNLSMDQLYGVWHRSFPFRWFCAGHRTPTSLSHEWMILPYRWRTSRWSLRFHRTTVGPPEQPLWSKVLDGPNISHAKVSVEILKVPIWHAIKNLVNTIKALPLWNLHSLNDNNVVVIPTLSRCPHLSFYFSWFVRQESHGLSKQDNDDDDSSHCIFHHCHYSYSRSCVDFKRLYKKYTAIWISIDKVE